MNLRIQINELALKVVHQLFCMTCHSDHTTRMNCELMSDDRIPDPTSVDEDEVV